MDRSKRLQTQLDEMNARFRDQENYDQDLDDESLRPSDKNLFG